MYLIHLYRNFKISVRAGDLDLFVSCLPEITNILFAMNHLIYTRWLVKSMKKQTVSVFRFPK